MIRRIAKAMWVFLLAGISNSASVSVFAAQTTEGPQVAQAEEIQEALVKAPATNRARMPVGVIQLDETVISGNQELPKVLYILPWRQPRGLPHIELKTEFTQMDLFRRLYPPAYRRELEYFETLDGINSEE